MRGRVGVARAGGGQCAMWGGLWWAVRSLQVGVGEGARVTRAGARVHARRGAVCGASITRLLPKAGRIFLRARRALLAFYQVGGGLRWRQSRFSSGLGRFSVAIW